MANYDKCNGNLIDALQANGLIPNIDPQVGEVNSAQCRKDHCKPESAAAPAETSRTTVRI